MFTIRDSAAVNSFIAMPFFHIFIGSIPRNEISVSKRIYNCFNMT